MRNYMTIFLAGRSFLIKTKRSKKAEHLQILQVKPVPINGMKKVTISLIAGKIKLRNQQQ